MNLRLKRRVLVAIVNWPKLVNALQRHNQTAIIDDGQAMADRQNVVVTGCSTGIGAHCAARLKEDGYRVLVSARSEEDLARLKAEGFEAHYLEHRDAASVDAFVEWALAACDGAVHGWFNNAGYAQPGAVEDLPVEALREQIEVNLFAYHQIMVRVVPVMRAQGYGRIINCSSVLGRICVPWRGAYTASKAALNALTITLRQELYGSGVHASVIEPGAIPSNIAVNAIQYADRWIDAEGSVHGARYQKRLADLRSQVPPTDLSGAEPVYKALRHALTAKRPRPHYPVCKETHIAFWAMRLLPRELCYRLFERAA